MAVRPLPARRSPWASAWDLLEVRWAGLALVLFALGGIAELTGAASPLWWALYLACYVAGGWEPALAGLRALREKTLDVDVLMIVAAIAAAAIGQVRDGGLLIVIFATSGALEAFVTRRTADSVSALLELTPDRATRVHAAGEEVVDVAELEVGDRILVRPGERIGADGVVVEGSSEVDQATITGEPLPVLKSIDSEVYAGTVNGTGSLTVRVGAAAHESVVARIVALVEDASQTKAATQLFIEKVEQRYSVIVVIGTLLIVAIPLIAGAAFQPSLLRAMTFMIVASPCAVVLATMPPLLAAIANAGRHGVLIKSAVALESLRGVEVVVFDKTGTLTHGSPLVVDVVQLADHSADDVLAAAASAEQHSEHPIARAVVAAARARRLTLSAAGEFHATPGRGITARVADRTLRVGSPLLLDELSGAEAVRPSVVDLEEAGHTVVAVIVDDQPVGLIALTDEIRPTSRPTVERLSADGLRSILLTGDHALAARHVGDRVGVAEAYGGLLPAHKAATITALQDEGRRVLLVGDGINDAPAMATADVAVAMGRGGSDLAVETADVILVHDDIAAIPATVELAHRAHRVVKANIIFAACVIVALVTWDFAGHLPLPLGVAGHEGSTVVVGLNGLRLLRRHVWKADAT
ncbi:heavy metal translocating P-type ATPase [Nocardioides sp. KR10-350]|uniref:heavy metal translocating P-type ATPase n=1 Tax=Nocardioides cheoyonin TaxID=3156615 RepID=UPI0032B4DD8B